jgi:hypothetical protein
MGEKMKSKIILITIFLTFYSLKSYSDGVSCNLFVKPENGREVMLRTNAKYIFNAPSRGDTHSGKSARISLKLNEYTDGYFNREASLDNLNFIRKSLNNPDINICNVNYGWRSYSVLAATQSYSVHRRRSFAPLLIEVMPFCNGGSIVVPGENEPTEIHSFWTGIKLRGSYEYKYVYLNSKNEEFDVRLNCKHHQK